MALKSGLNYIIMSKEINNIHIFKVHAPNLFKEVIDSLSPNDRGAIYMPLTLFNRYLMSVVVRCAEINDPVLNKLMVEMALYEQADPSHPDYDPEILEIVEKNYRDYIKKQRNPLEQTPNKNTQ